MDTYPVGDRPPGTVVSLTTDYGLADGFVGACKGVILETAPTARMVDITHLIPPGDIRRAAHVLAQTLPYLPEGSVHMAVVDPGVGTVRHPLALATPTGVLIGPDNGLLGWAADALGGITQAVSLSNERYHRHPVSRTFHGRDVFAPAAAHVATGVPLTSLGDPLDVHGIVRLSEPAVIVGDEGFEAEATTVDRFGNVQLAAPPEDLDALGESLDVNGRAARRADVFASGEPGALIVLVDSAGFASIAVNGGSAAETLGIGPGDLVRVRQA
ncbi:SAM-dependent chlorinase/fluorinase [Phytomonospora sp. NPDC050363]|uniref:SAM hydrolase/SAM-dependent halogenase family protein n=1 Tax=Phytomonospora sp. NPDC050363 TaxID=3155642 RepID=UPI0033E65490